MSLASAARFLGVPTFTALLAAGLLPACHGPSHDPDGSGPGGYVFTSDWFSHNIPVWESVLQEYRDAQDVSYLEVGVYEGRSLLWMSEHVLTQPTSRLTGIDIELTDNLRSNLERSEAAERVTLIEGPSQRELSKLAPESFDIIYIDGSHAANDVLADAVMSWELLKTGGLLIFDDYGWNGRARTGAGPLPAPLLPGPAIDSFLEAYVYEVEVVHDGYQLMVRKRENPCGEHAGNCTPFGRYVYHWKEHRLYAVGNWTEPVETSEEERDLIERILLEGIDDPEVRGSPLFDPLRERLGLGPG